MIKKLFVIFVGMFVFCSAFGGTSGTWEVTSSMKTNRATHTATKLADGRVLVAGGDNCGNSTCNTATAEIYDPTTGAWIQTGSLNTGRIYHKAILLPNGQVLVAGGGTSSGELSSAELYNPSTGAWTPTGSMSVTRVFNTITLLQNGKVLVAGGRAPSGGAFSSAELYDPATGAWTPTGSMSVARTFHSATLLPNGKVLVAGGGGSQGNGPFLASAELYDPATGAWTPTGYMKMARSGDHMAVLLSNGQVLVAGGCNGYGCTPLTSAELYNPATGTWTPTGSMNMGHSGGGFIPYALLPNGQVLIAGGTYPGSYSGSTELYNPDTGTWIFTGSMNTARGFNTLTLLSNGQVLVAGGQDSIQSTFASAELYNPIYDPHSSVESSSVPQPPIESGCNCICSYYDNYWSGKHIESLGEIPDADICNKLCSSAYYGKMEGCFEKEPKSL